MFKQTLLLALLVSAAATASTRQVQLSSVNTVTFRGEVNTSSVNDAMKQLATLEEKRGDRNYTLYLVLDTPGGEVDEGLALIEYAKTIPNLHTITLFAASMGSAIVEGLPGKRLILENGTLMFHRAKAGVQGQIGEGEVEQRLAWIKNIVAIMERKNSSRMGISVDDYRKRVKDEMWLLGDEAIKDKAADEIVELKCTRELINKSEIKEVQIFIFNLKFKFSACPLFRAGEQVQTDEKAKNLFNSYKSILQEKFSPGVLQ